jgi:hypothetical protein
LKPFRSSIEIDKKKKKIDLIRKHVLLNMKQCFMLICAIMLLWRTAMLLAAEEEPVDIESASPFNCSMPSQVVEYVGVFLLPSQREKLLHMFPPVHSVLYATHMTMAYQPCDDYLHEFELMPWGLPVELRVLGNQSDSKGQALVVSPMPHVYSQNEFKHVTVSCIDGVGAVYSNEMLESEGYVHLQSPLPILFGRVGASLYNGTIIYSIDQLPSQEENQQNQPQ